MPNRVMSQFFFDFFLSRSTQILRTGTLPCFGKFLLPKKFMEKRGGLQKFPSKFLGLTVSKKIRSGILYCVTSFGYRIFFCLGD